MEIFVGNLPRRTSVLALRKLIGRMGNVRYKIVQTTNKEGRPLCYGHVIINNNKQGIDIIARLNGADFEGSELYARPLHDRNEYNERRNRKSYMSNWSGVDRRKSDRRNSYN